MIFFIRFFSHNNTRENIYKSKRYYILFKLSCILFLFINKKNIMYNIFIKHIFRFDFIQKSLCFL